MTRPGLPIRRVVRIASTIGMARAIFGARFFETRPSRVPIWRIDTDVWILLKEIRAKWRCIDRYDPFVDHESRMCYDGVPFWFWTERTESWFRFIRWKSIKFCLFVCFFVYKYFSVCCWVNIIDRAQFEKDWNRLKIVECYCWYLE